MTLENLLTPVASKIADELVSRRAEFVKWVTEIWDQHGEPIDLPGVPDAVVDPIIRRVLEAGAGLAMDRLVAEFRELANVEPEAT